MNCLIRWVWFCLVLIDTKNRGWMKLDSMVHCAYIPELHLSIALHTHTLVFLITRSDLDLSSDRLWSDRECEISYRIGVVLYICDIIKIKVPIDSEIYTRIYLQIIRWHVGLITVAWHFNDHQFCTCVIVIFIFFVYFTLLFCIWLVSGKGHAMLRNASTMIWNCR